MKEYVYVFKNNKYDKWNFIYRGKTFQPASPDQVTAPGVYEIKNVTYENDERNFGYANIKMVPDKCIPKNIEVKDVDYEGFPDNYMNINNGEFDSCYDMSIVYKQHGPNERFFPILILSSLVRFNNIMKAMTLFTEEDGSKKWHEIYHINVENPIYNWSRYYIDYDDIPMFTSRYNKEEFNIIIRINSYLQEKTMKKVFENIKTYDDHIMNEIVTAVRPRPVIYANDEIDKFSVSILESGIILLTTDRYGIKSYDKTLYEVIENTGGWLELHRITDIRPVIESYLKTTEVKKKITGKEIINICREKKILFCAFPESALDKLCKVCSFAENQEYVHTYENGEEVYNLLKGLDYKDDVCPYLSASEITIYPGNGECKKWLVIAFSPVAYANMSDEKLKLLKPIVDKCCDMILETGKRLAKQGMAVEHCRKFSPNYFLPNLCF